MEQVSRPLLIVLGASVLLVALWFTALRPKPVAVSNTPLAPVEAIDKAKAISAASDAANAKLQAATGGNQVAATPPAAATAPAGPAGAAAAAAEKRSNARRAAARPDAAVMRDMRRGKVVVLLFWNATSPDDVAARGAVRGIDRRGGKVAVHVSPLSRAAAYTSITRDVAISQSPTTLVIDRRRRARAIVGLTEPGELEQAVGDALAGRR